MPLRTIAEVAALTTDLRDRRDLGGQVRFLSTATVDRAGERYWDGLVHFVYRQAVLPESPLGSPLLRRQLIDSLAAAALTVFPNTTMFSDYTPGAGQVGPATLRRALAHLHAHAGDPVTVGEVAAAAGIGVRALQAAFVQHLSLTPTAYLRWIRLERAHHDLRAAAPRAGDTVTAVAARWGGDRRRTPRSAGLQRGRC